MQNCSCQDQRKLFVLSTSKDFKSILLAGTGQIMLFKKVSTQRFGSAGKRDSIEWNDDIREELISQGREGARGKHRTGVGVFFKRNCHFL